MLFTYSIMHYCSGGDPLWDKHSKKAKRAILPWGDKEA
jgi:hypothetical protein